jgi:hypothetical protein
MKPCPSAESPWFPLVHRRVQFKRDDCGALLVRTSEDAPFGSIARCVARLALADVLQLATFALVHLAQEAFP